jgi:hypothetical protein
MPDARIVEWIRGEYVALVCEPDERARRRWAAVEAVSLGREVGLPLSHRRREYPIVPLFYVA